MVQRIKMRLPTQGTHVQSLSWEDSTCLGAPKPISHNYRACELQLLKLVCLQPLVHNKKATAMRNLCTTMKSSPCLLQLEKATKTQCSQKEKLFEKSGQVESLRP